MNKYYNHLNGAAKSRFHARYAKIFRTKGRLSPGKWVVIFAKRNIKMPIRPLWSWLDWDSAISIVGHDIEVKQTYEFLVNSNQRPELFLDVGANYGTHSVLFLSVGIPIIAFEPNPRCRSQFAEICQLNGLAGRWEEVAIGQNTGIIELVYPERDTWLGSVSSDVKTRLQGFSRVNAQMVPLKRLDDYLSDVIGKKILVKIDVEGFEREVLRGAINILKESEPKIIFESNDITTRSELFEILVDYRFRIYLLPWSAEGGAQPLGHGEFRRNMATNFIAIRQDVIGAET